MAKKMYISLTLDDLHKKAIVRGKKKTGISATTDYLRYLIMSNDKEGKS